MKKNVLAIYALVVLTVTVLFSIYGENRDPRYYLTMLVLVIVMEIIWAHIDK
jgi:hypothetical protein